MSLGACVPSPLAYVVPPMVRVCPSPAACSPLLRLRSTGPQPFAAELHGRSPSWLIPVGGGTGVPGVTRYITVPCAGTDALIAPEVVLVCFDHRSLRAYDVAPPSPIASAVVATALAVVFSFVSVTERPPSARGLDITTSPPPLDTTAPCRPSASWSTAMTSAFLRTSRVAEDTVRRSLPISRGAAICAHRLKWVRYSVSVMPPLPTSSMSGSFQAPGFAYGARGWFWCAMPIMLDQESEMSPVVRHEFPYCAAQFQGWFSPHSQMLYRI